LELDSQQLKRVQALPLEVKLSLNSGYPSKIIIDFKSQTEDNSNCFFEAKAQCYFQMYGDQLRIETESNKTTIWLDFESCTETDIDITKFIYSGPKTTIYKSVPFGLRKVKILSATPDVRTLITLNPKDNNGLLWIYIADTLLPINLEEVKQLKL
jgi:hypothetical protein